MGAQRATDRIPYSSAVIQSSCECKHLVGVLRFWINLLFVEENFFVAEDDP
jgi:hypothetical protein